MPPRAVAPPARRFGSSGPAPTGAPPASSRTPGQSTNRRGASGGRIFVGVHPVRGGQSRGEAVADTPRCAPKLSHPPVARPPCADYEVERRSHKRRSSSAPGAMSMGGCSGYGLRWRRRGNGDAPPTSAPVLLNVPAGLVRKIVPSSVAALYDDQLIIAVHRLPHAISRVGGSE